MMVRRLKAQSLAGSAPLAFVAVLGGCGSGPGMEPPVESQQSELVTGATSITNSPHELMQSETVQYSSALGQTVSYNDSDTPPFEEYPNPSDRIVRSDASLMGWAFKPAGATAWSFGKLFPDVTSTISVLWGDPAIGSISGSSQVFLSNAASPTSIFPGEVHGPMVVAGACVARSTDNGQSFSLVDADCPNFQNEFYDGSALQGSSTNMYAAYLDINRSQIHVWRASATAAFTDAVNGGGMLPVPFPGLTIVSHPRLRWFADAGDLALAAVDSSGTLWLTFFVPGEFPFWTTPAVVATDAETDAFVTVGSKSIRFAAGFSFDIAHLGTNNNKALFWYTHANGAGTQLKGVSCLLQPAACSPVASWQTSSSANAFGPAVSVNTRTVAGKLRQHWRVSYYSTDGASAGNVRIVDGAFTPTGFLQTFITGQQAPCPDLRGYWGDYDEMVGAQGVFSGFTPFVRTFTDSSLAPGETCTQEMYRGIPQHVSQVTIP